MKVTSFFISALAATAAATGRFRSKDVLATFDELDGLPGLPEVNPLGYYKGLEYNSFDLLEAGILGVITTGIAPESGLHTAATSITASGLRGGPAFSAATDSFDLQSLYLACAVDSVESVAGVPQQCTVAFTAYKRGSTTPFDTVDQPFNPTGPLLSDMALATFPASWTGLGRVEVTAVQATTGATLNALLIDSIQYTQNYYN